MENGVMGMSRRKFTKEFKEEAVRDKYPGGIPPVFFQPTILLRAIASAVTTPMRATVCNPSTAPPTRTARILRQCPENVSSALPHRRPSASGGPFRRVRVPRHHAVDRL